MSVRPHSASVTIRLDDALMAALDAYCEAAQLSYSEVFRRALRLLLELPPPEPSPKPHPTSDLSPEQQALWQALMERQSASLLAYLEEEQAQHEAEQARLTAQALRRARGR